MKNKSNEKNKAYESHLEASDYQPKPLNYKKIIISFTSIILIVVSSVLIWLFAFKGKAYLDYKKEAQKFYNQIFKNPKKENINSFNFGSEDIKQSTSTLIDDINTIYKVNGFQYTQENGKIFKNYKYKDRKMEILTIGKSDYLFNFIDKDLLVPKDPINHYPHNMSNSIFIRIKDYKISAIGLKYDDGKLKNEYRWLKGSNTKNMKGR